ncbi:MAG: KTSC domain-containing protein [Lautropia sp.]
MSITLTPCKSAGIKALGYDAATKTLAIEFGSGVYHYADVPPEVYGEMKASESIGGFYSRSIRGKFTGALQPKPEEADGK